MKIAIVGSRTFEDYDAMRSFIEEKLATMEHTTIEAVVSGGARGADALAERYAQERGLRMIIFPANGKSMVGEQDLFAMWILSVNVMYALPFGTARATAHSTTLSYASR